jgi:hypothetical protein
VDFLKVKGGGMAALRGSLFRPLAGLMAALLILFQTSCATRPRLPSLDLHLKLQTQRIALVPARFQVAEDLELFARGRLSGMGKEGVKSALDP